MNLDIQNLPPEVAAYIQSLEQKTQQLEQKNQQLEKQLVKMQSLNEQLVRMRKRMFRASPSEQVQYLDGKQLDFFNEAEMCSDAGAPEPGKTTPVKAHARKAKRTKEDLTEGLEHRKVLCELTEEEQICETCGSKMVRIGEKFVRSELVIVPAQVYVVDYYSTSYKCAHCEAKTGETSIRAGTGSCACYEEKHGSSLHRGLCDAGKVPERSSPVSPGSLLEGTGRGSAPQHHGKLGDPQFPVV